MEILPSQPVSIAKVLKLSFRLYAASFDRLLKFFVALAAPACLIGLLVYFVSGLFVEPLKLVVGGHNANTIVGLVTLLLGAIVMLATLILYVVSYPSLVYRIANAPLEHDSSFLQTLNVGLKKLPSIIFAVILLTIALLLGYVFFIVPGVILSVSTAFYIYFIVIESLGAYDSLKASHNLVWGHWWRTLVIFAVPFVLVILLYLAVGFILSLVVPENSFMPSLINLVLSSFSLPYFFTLGYVQFNDLKLRQAQAEALTDSAVPKTNMGG